MSEEILQAMMELFALIVRQDGRILRVNVILSLFPHKKLKHQSTDEFIQLLL